MKFFNFYALIFLFCLYGNFLYAQNLPCGTDELYQQNMQNDSEYYQKYEEEQNAIYERSIEYYNTPSHLKVGEEDIYTIPVVVHLIHNPDDLIGNGINVTDEEIENAITYLNNSFSNSNTEYDSEGVNTNIQFCLASIGPNGAPTNGIDRYPSEEWTYFCSSTEKEAMLESVAWDVNKYFNIYVMETIHINKYEILPNGGNGQLLGCIKSVGGQGWSEGIYIRYSSIKKSSFPHEVGHYLNLIHSFSQTCSNNDCLWEGDHVCDTPPDISKESVSCYNNDFENSCSTDTDDTSINNPFTTDVNDMVENYMDYNYSSCRTRFTEGQKVRMRLDIEENKSCLLNSNKCNSNPPSLFSYQDYDPVMYFQANYEFGDEYLWDFGDGTTGDEKNYVHTYAENGTYTVSLTIIDSNCNQYYELDIVIDNIEECNIEANFTQDESNDPTITFTSMSTDADTYFWDFGDGATSTDENPTHTYAANGSYTVYLTVTNEDCDEEDMHGAVITVNDIEEPCNVTAGFTYDDSNSPEVSFTSTSTDAELYFWDFNDGSGSSSQEENPIYTFSMNGSYTVQLRIYNSACDAFDHYEMTIIIDNVECQEIANYNFFNNNIPEETHVEDWIKMIGVSVNSGENVIFQAGDYIEIKPGSPTFNPVAMIEYGANFEAYIAPCEAGAGKKEIVKEEATATSLKVYPNPFSDIFNIEYRTDKEIPVTISIYNMEGQLEMLVKDQEIHPIGNHNIEVDAQPLEEGIYIVQILTENQKITQKLIKMR